jgi:membrane protease YdiL (CAAX protease family)
VFRFWLWLLAAYLRSGARSVASFTRGLGLSQRPNLGGWLGACAAIAIALVDRHGGARGWTSPNPTARGFYGQGGWFLLFYVTYVTSAGPFFEEIVLRGFAFRGFRNGYGCLSSMVIVVAAGANFHLDAVARSLWTPICLISLWILLCGIIERTANLWNCVLCHAAYNAFQVFKWPVSVLGMLLILPFCMRSAKPGRAVTR